MSKLTPAQQDGLNQVLNLMDTHNLTPADVKTGAAARKSVAKEASGKAFNKGEMILRLFAYLGGTMIFAGLGVFIETIWDDIGSLPRVVITLGSGFIAYILGLLFANDARFEKIATPAFILAFLMQPTGLFVFLDEYTTGEDAALGGIFVFGLLFIQQGLTFLKFPRPALALFTLLYGIGLAASTTEYFDIDRGLSSLMCGVCLFFLTVDFQKREHFRDLTPVFYFLSTAFFFGGLYYFIGGTILDPLALSITLGLLWFAVHQGSKTLYVLSLLYVFGYFCGGPGGGWSGGWNEYRELTAIFTGASLALTGHWLRNSNYISLFPLWMFTGMAFALGGLYSLVYDTPFETLFVGFAALGIYASLLMRSRAMLAASVLWLIGFITAFSAEHFAGTIGWPLLLMLLGFVILGAGFGFARLAGRIKHAAA